MKFYDLENNSVEIIIPSHHKTIVVDVSGGTDSALLLYFISRSLENRSDVTVIVRHIVDLVRVPYTKPLIQKIVSEFEYNFPSIKYQTRFLQFVEKKPTVTKTYSLEKDKTEILKQNSNITFFGSVTANPPEQVQKDLDMWESGRLKIREKDQRESRILYKPYDKNMEVTTIDKCNFLNAQPFLLVDKKFISYFYFNETFLKNSIFKLTASCVCSDVFITKNWTVPCKSCWWCKEKKWAFGRYDNEDLS
jgi:hypothetical protein